MPDARFFSARAAVIEAVAPEPAQERRHHDAQIEFLGEGVVREQW